MFVSIIEVVLRGGGAQEKVYTTESKKSQIN